MYSASINKGASLEVVMAAYDRYGEGIIMISGFGYTQAVKEAQRNIKKKCDIMLCYIRFVELGKALTANVSHMQDSEYSHIVLYKKDQNYVKDGKERIKLFAFAELEQDESWSDLYDMVLNDKFPQKLLDIVYDKLYKMCPVPILPAWIPYLLKFFINEGYFKAASTCCCTGIKPVFCGILDVAVEDIVNRLQVGLQNERISIGNGTTSSFMKNVEGIDSYLSEFSEVLTKKIQTSFRPMFIPKQEQLCEDLSVVYDYMKYNDHISLYPAQTAVAQAVTNAFNEGKRACFVIAECGSGKTSLAIAAVNSHFGAFRRNDPYNFMTNIVMCPAHLVTMWKREIEQRSPRSKAIIIKDFAHLISVIPEIKGKKRYQHLWLILSKETAKFGYEMRPSVVWREHKKIPGIRRNGVYCCPSCGQMLFYETKEGRGRYRHTERHYLTEESFRKESAVFNNLTCHNRIKVWNKKTREWEWQLCNTPLWGPSTKDTLYDGNPEHEDRWVKLPRQGGWMQRRHLRTVYDRLAAKETQTSDDLQLMTAIDDELNGDGLVQRAPRKYPIATYIKKYLKGYIDYVIADEIHVLKSKDSLQGEAFGDIMNVAKYTIALTGTLLNGFCSGIYYLLFRLFPQHMIKEGYDYGNSQEFSRDYGVARKSQTFEMDHGVIGNQTGSTVIKEMPGVSPLVFTKFLLENAAFISLDDIADALPSYEEIPIPLEMPEDLHSAYNNLKNRAREILGRKCKNSTASQVIQLLSVYPDQPYDQPCVYDPETNDILITPEELPAVPRIKENALLSLCQNKIAAGEHVLVYYSWTNRTDIKERLPRYLESFDIKTAVLTTSVKPQDREAWIQKQIDDGVQVLFCNPSLVETGLTLLDFTTIVFYQTSYNLYTMRQASRRSWRINQNHDVQVYFLYYQDTVQEQALSLMATKLQAAMAIEGKFSQEGLNAMSNNEDILTQIAASVTEDIKETVDVQVFQKHKIVNKKTMISEEKTEQTDIKLPLRFGILNKPLSKEPYDCNDITADIIKDIHKQIDS